MADNPEVPGVAIIQNPTGAFQAVETTGSELAQHTLTPQSSGGSGQPLFNVVTKTANYQAAAFDYVIDATGIIVTLPAAASTVAGDIVVVETDAAGFVTTIDAHSGSTNAGNASNTQSGGSLNDLPTGYPMKVALVAKSPTLWSILYSTGNDYGQGDMIGDLFLAGPLGWGENTQTANYQALAGDLYISYLQATARTVTLPATTTGVPQVIIISNQNHGVMTITPHGSDTCDTATVPPFTAVILYGSDQDGGLAHHHWAAIAGPNSAATVNVVAAAGAAQTAKVGGNDFTLSANLTVTMPTAAAGSTCYVIVRQAAGGGDTVTFTGVKWPGGTPPTISTGDNAVDIFSFVSDGTSWFGTTVGQAFA